MNIKDFIRKAALFISYSALFFIFLLAILIFFTRTAYFRNWLSQTVHGQIEKRGKIQLFYKEIEGGLFSGMTVRGIVIKCEGKEDDSIKCETLKIKLHFPDLIKGTLALPHIVCAGLHISIIRTKEGSFVLPPFPPPSPTAMPAPQKEIFFSAILLEKLTVMDSTVIFTDHFQKESPHIMTIGSIETECTLRLSTYFEKLWWNADIKTLSFSLSPYPIGTLYIKGQLAQQKDVLNINNVEINTGASALSLSGKIKLAQEPSIDIHHSSFALSLDEVRNIVGRGFLPSALSELHTLKGEAKAQGKLSDLACSLLLSYAFDQQESTINIKGTINLDDPSTPHYRLRAELNRFPLSRWIPSSLNGSSSHTIDLNAQISGMGIRPKEMSTDFTLHTTSFTLYERQIEAVSLQGQFEKENLTMNKIALHTPFGMVRAEGEIDVEAPFPYEFSVTFQQLDLKGLKIKEFPSSNLAGQVKMKGVLGKRITEDFEASGSIELFPSRIGDIYPDYLFLKGHYGSDMIHLSEGKMQMEGLRFSAYGTVCQGTNSGIQDEKRVSLCMDLEELDLALLKLLKKDLPLQGIVTGKGTISGCLKEPLFDVNLQGNKITFQDFHINEMMLNGRCKGITPFESIGFSGTIHALSILFKKNTYLDSLSLEAHKDEEHEIVWSIKGNSKNTSLIDARGAVEIQNLRQLIARIDSITFPLGPTIWKNKEPIRCETDEQGVRISSCTLSSAQGIFSLQGAIEWGGAQKISLTLSEVSLDQLHNVAAQSIPFGGVLDADLKVSGSFNAPLMKGYAVIKNGIAGQFKFDEFRHDISYDQKQLDLIASLSQEGRKTLHLSGKLPIDLAFQKVQDRFSLQGFFVDIRIDQLDLGFIPSLLPSITMVQGTLSGKGQISGSLGEPHFDTELDFVNTSFQIMPLSQIFTLQEARIQGTHERIIIDGIKILGTSGSALLSTTIELSQFSLDQFIATLNMEQWKILYSSDSHFVCDGEMKAQGTLSDINLSGSVTLPSVKVKISDFIGSNRINPEVVMVKERGKKPDFIEKKPGFFMKNVIIDTHVHIPRNLWIIHDQANIELKGDIHILKAKENNPRVLGDIQSVRGYYTFYNKEFEVQKAVLTFQGLTVINPQIDMRTVYRVGGVNIFIIITGTKNAPVVTLQSDPSMPQNDIISYLIFGRATEDLSQRESANLQAQAFALVGRIVAMQVMGIFGEKFSVDTIQIRASKQGTPSLEIGKYLARDVYVAYSRELGQQKSEMLTVEYYLYSNLTLETEIRADDRSGIDLIWKKDF
ncbi:MAG: translocation/assembly module TamB domain-containing protein [bacterium]